MHSARCSVNTNSLRSVYPITIAWRFQRDNVDEFHLNPRIYHLSWQFLNINPSSFLFVGFCARLAKCAQIVSSLLVGKSELLILYHFSLSFRLAVIRLETCNERVTPYSNESDSRWKDTLLLGVWFRRVWIYLFVAGSYIRLTLSVTFFLANLCIDSNEFLYR